MTLSRETPTGTATFQPPIAGRFPDVWQISRPPQIAPVQGSLGPARYSVNAVPGVPNLYHWMLNWYDLRGGLVQRDRFDVNHAAWSASTGIDTRYKQVACLPFLTTGYSSPAAPASIEMTIISAWVPAFNGLAVAFQNLNALHSYLYTETSSTNPAMVQLTYDTGWPITCLAPVSVNGTDYLAVGQTGQNVRLLSNLTQPAPTDAGALGSGSSTIAVTGIMQVPLPHAPILLRQGGTIIAGNSDVAIGSFAPTVTSTGLPIGGWPLGPSSFAGSPTRAWWVVGDGNPGYIVPGNAGGGSSINTNLFRGRLASTNLFGFDYQETALPLKSVQIGTLIRDGGAFSDTERVIFYNGRTQRDLRIFADPPQNSDKVYRVVGFYVQQKTELFAEVNEIATANGSNVTRRAIWRYDFDLDCWQQVSTWTTLTATTGIQSFMGMGNTGTLPVSNLTGFFHEHATQATSGTTWFRQFQSLPGINPMSLRKTTSATATTGVATEASATFTSPVFDIPGLEGWPKLIARVQGPPSANISSGGTGAYMLVDVGDGSTPAKFTATEPTGRYPVDDEFYNRSEVETIQIIVSAFRATTGTDPTLLNMNVLPITVEGFCYKEALAIPARWTAGQRAA